MAPSRSHTSAKAADVVKIGLVVSV